MAMNPLDRSDTVVSPVPLLIRRLRATYAAGTTRPLAWRRAQLAGIRRFTVEHEAAIVGALNADLGKGEAEALTSEIVFVRAEIDHMLAHLTRWTADERQPVPLFLRPGRSYIRREPLGVALVIGAWNLPVPVLLGPAVAAIAAGNAVVLKPSELAPATAALIEDVLPCYVDNAAIAVQTGGVEVTTTLLEERFDHIFYTGNGRVGRIVAAAAARHLTPVTLELGGRNPVIVDDTADIAVSAKRIAWAKWMNAGQVCVSPDHLLVTRGAMPKLITALKETLASFYGDDPATHQDYGSIVNDAHFQRLMRLLENHGGELVHGGTSDRVSRYIAPTIVIGPHATSLLMRDEIFGPILPIVPVDDVDAAIAIINAGPKPLVVHAFTRDRVIADRVEARTSSGAFLVNDAIVNHRIAGLPFGGVGESGMGAYHGRAGFETFTHRKAVLRRPTWLDQSLRYPPFTPARLRRLRQLIGA
jgi:aldehyde dehydrogenase (NAD+)